MKDWMAATALAVCALLSWSLPAVADWRDTRWGMTPNDLTVALGTVAQPNGDRGLDADGLRAAIVASYEGSVSFTAAFLFDPENRLQVVNLKPIGGDACHVVVQALDANHGAPEGVADTGRIKTLRWDDVENDNLIVYADFGGGDCTVQYSKLPPTQPDGKGL